MRTCHPSRARRTVRALRAAPWSLLCARSPPLLPSSRWPLTSLDSFTILAVLLPSASRGGGKQTEWHAPVLRSTVKSEFHTSAVCLQGSLGDLSGTSAKPRRACPSAGPELSPATVSHASQVACPSEARRIQPGLWLTGAVTWSRVSSWVSAQIGAAVPNLGCCTS